MEQNETYEFFPVGISRAYRGHIVDTRRVDYIDMMSAWGSNILGYGYRRVAKAVAAQISRYANAGMVGPEWHRLHELVLRLVPCAEAIHLVKNGSDATTTAIRLARSVTGRDKVVFRGYHGVQDWYMASIRCPGVPSSHHEEIVRISTLDGDSLRQIFATYPDQIACLILDPMVWPIPDQATMSAVRDTVHEHGALLVFDEVVSGFRVAIGGAQELWNVLPDLACYGKCIANGLPLAMVAGKAQWMEQVPSINYGLTFSLEAVSIVAAVETIDEIVKRCVCLDLAEKGRFLKETYSKLCHLRGIESALVGHDCRPELHFALANGADAEYLKNTVIHELGRRRVCSYGTFNVSYGHTWKDIKIVCRALESALDRVKAEVADRGRAQVT
jgi:glutamate-1-semialdehyde 2,1-aminomutase